MWGYVMYFLNLVLNLTWQGAPNVLLPLYHLPHSSGRASHQPHQSSFPSYDMVHGPNPLLIIIFSHNDWEIFGDLWVFMGHSQSIHVQKQEVMDSIKAQEESGQ